MSPTLILLAGCIARPRGRRRVCDGSRFAMSAGCVDHGTVVCPICERPVNAEPYLPRAVVLAVHAEVRL